MYFKSMCLVIFLGILCTNIHADKNDEDNLKFFQDLIKIIGAYLNITLNAGLKNLRQPLIDLNKLGIENVNGTFYANSTSIGGLHTIYLPELPKFGIHENFTLKNMSGDRSNFSAKLSFENLNISFIGYVMDMGLFKLLPLYGEGNLELGVNNIGLEMDTSIARLSNTTTNQTLMTDLKLILTFRHSKINITGFWLNDKLSNYLTDIFTLFENIVAMFWNYNAETIGCVVGDIAKYFINKKLFKTPEEFGSVSSDCLGKVSVKVADVVLRAKQNGDLTEFLGLLEKTHVESLMKFIDDKLASSSLM